MVNNFRQKKCYFCPAPLGFLEVVFLLVILAGLSLVSRRNLDGLSKLVIYFCVAFSPYSHPSNKNSYKKSEVVPNLFQGYSKNCCLFLWWIDNLLTPDWRVIDTLLTKKCNFKAWAVPTLFPPCSQLIPTLFPKFVIKNLFSVDRLHELVMKFDVVQTSSERFWDVLNREW